MLYLILQLGEERYALDTSRIVEIVPYVNLKPVPHAPGYVSGVFNFRSTLVPVIDLCCIVSGQPSRTWLTTRIVVVEYPLDEPGRETRELGLLVEQVSDTRKLDDSQFESPGIAMPDSPYLGDIARLEDGLVQRVEARQLLPDTVRNLLFREYA